LRVDAATSDVQRGHSRVSGVGRRSPQDPLDPLDEEEDGDRDDEEVQAAAEEHAVVDGDGGVRPLRGLEDPLQRAEVEAGEKKAERGRDDVGDERSDDLPEEAPTMTPTASSGTFPRLMKVRNGMTRPPVQPSSFGRRPGGGGFSSSVIVWVMDVAAPQK